MYFGTVLYIIAVNDIRHTYITFQKKTLEQLIQYTHRCAYIIIIRNSEYDVHIEIGPTCSKYVWVQK